MQLDLLAPDAENKDLFYRRLREGNKDNWLDELAHSEREMASIEDKLATLYERRGQIVEMCIRDRLNIMVPSNHWQRL